MTSSLPRANGNSVRAVILDYGEVLSHPPDPASIASMAHALNLPVDRFRHIYAAHRHDYDRGTLTAEQYWTALANDAGVTLSPQQIASLRVADVRMWSSLDPVMMRWAADLRHAGLRTAVLSNMHLDMVDFLRSHADWLSRFDCTILSSELRMAKPEAEIFRHCLHCLQVEPAEALFIDDREPNVEAARALGINAICANSPAQIRQRLQPMAWSAPLPA